MADEAPDIHRRAGACGTAYSGFKSPEEAVRDPVHFIAHVLTYGTHEDMQALRHQVSDEELARAIRNAPPGVFDVCSWTYWNLKIGWYPTPLLPGRKYG